MSERLADALPIDGICELTLQAANVERLSQFYCRVFGCSEISRDQGRVWLSCGTHARLGIWPPGAKEFGDRGGRHVHFAFSCTPGRLDSLAERMGELGVGHEGPIAHPGGDRSLYVEDPERNVVEVWDFFRRGDGARDGVRALEEG